MAVSSHSEEIRSHKPRRRLPDRFSPSIQLDLFGTPPIPVGVVPLARPNGVSPWSAIGASGLPVSSIGIPVTATPPARR